MRSGTSYFEKEGLFSPALFRKNIERLWPLWVGYLGMVELMLPINLFSYAENSRNYTALDAGEQILDSLSRGYGVFLLMVVGVIYATALFGFLMDRRQVQMLHALPVRREGLFLTSWLNGLVFLLLPNLMAVGLAFFVLVMEDAVGSFALIALLYWMLLWSSIGIFFFSFGVFCAMFTGNAMALPVFYGILNFLVMGVTYLVDLLLSNILIGYRSALVESVPVRWFTPVYQIMEQLNNDDIVGVMGYCLILSGFFAVLAVAVYRQRQLERAGDLVTVGWVRPVFQYGLGLCVGLLMGQLLYHNFFDFLPTVTLLPLVVLCSVVGAFAGRMLLKKSVKVFSDGWKGIGVFALVLALALGGAWTDFFGYQRRLPEAEEVSSITVYGPYTAPWDSGQRLELETKDPELIAQVLDLHASLVEDLIRLRSEKQDTPYDDYVDSQSISLLYELKDGSSVYRRYSNFVLLGSQLEDPDSTASKLTAFLNEPEVVRQSYQRDFPIEDGERKEPTVVSGRLLSVYEGEEVLVAIERGGEGETTQTQTISATAERDWTSLELEVGEAQQLWQAVQEDLDAGRIGKRYLFDNAEREENCYISDLELVFLYYKTGEEGKQIACNTELTITIQKSATATMAVLDELGYTDQLIPWGAD